MKIGTKSILFGAHCWFIHPFFVAAAWSKLYGFPTDPRLWVAFFVHDLGYWGKPNIDGDEGERHVEFGAKLMSWFDRFEVERHTGSFSNDLEFLNFMSTCNLDRLVQYSIRETCPATGRICCTWSFRATSSYWHDFTMYHSRFYAKKHGHPISRLCVADKLAICLEPAWLYLPRVWASGELAEFREVVKVKYAGEHRDNTSVLAWRRSMIDFLLPWVEANKGIE